MAHIPVNHPARPVYRALAFLIGVYLLVFGIVGVTQSTDHSFFANHEDITALGLHTNMAFSVLSIVMGAIVTVGAIYGRNLDHFINFGAGIVFMVAGLVMLILDRTSANLLNFTVGTCIVSFVIGMVLFAAGLYGKVAPDEVAAAEDRHRHSLAHQRHVRTGGQRVGRVNRAGFGSRSDRPFQARLTRCAATSSLRGLRTSSHHWPVSATMPTSICAYSSASRGIEAAALELGAQDVLHLVGDVVEEAGEVAGGRTHAASRGPAPGSRRSRLSM